MQSLPQSVINQLIDVYKAGQIESVAEQARFLIKKYPDEFMIWNLLGAANADLGRVVEAKNAFQRVIELNPSYADGYNNLGIIFREQGKLDSALKAYSKALSLNPEFADAYYNKGIVLASQGKLDGAIDAYNKALSINPEYVEAYINIGIALADQGKSEEAMEAYNKALSLNPKSSEASYNMGLALIGKTFKKPNPGLHKVIVSILDQKKYVRPKDICPAVISLLKLEPEMQKLLLEHSNDNFSNFFQESISVLSSSSLLLKLMSVCPIADLKFEVILKNIRSELLLSINKSKIIEDSKLLSFQSALALQCFINEYIYDLSNTDTKELKKLENLVEKTILSDKQPDPRSILCLASFKSLKEYHWCDLLNITSEIEAVFRRQVVEPREEDYLRVNIQTLEEITNKVSSKVKEQYEANPYPRWVNLGLRFEPASIPQVVDELNLRLFDNQINEIKAPKILVAGCGTGQHSIASAVRFKNAEVLAVDLSLSSLAYAMRKTRELKLQNIEYMQADILNLKNLDKKFDVIESGGVLHHMDDPFLGWEILTNCLNPGGLMKIGLYSELARDDIVKMRKELTPSGNAFNDIEMKSYRKSIMESEKPHHQQILNTSDFYSLSSLRDLLFHVKEHRFTIPQIKVYLNKLGLKFCGFEGAKLTKDFKLYNTKNNDCYDLDKWQVHETLNPKTFIGMYQFWCQKVA